MSIFHISQTPFSASKSLNLGEDGSTWTFGDWRDECATFTPFMGFDCSGMNGPTGGDKRTKHHFNTDQNSDSGLSGLEYDTSSMMNSECSDSCFESGLVHKKVFKIQKFPKKSRAFLSTSSSLRSEVSVPSSSTTSLKNAKKCELRRDVLHKCMLRTLRKFYKIAFKDIVVSKRRKHYSKEKVLENLRSEISQKLLSLGLDISYPSKASILAPKAILKSQDESNQQPEMGKGCAESGCIQSSMDCSIETSRTSIEIIDVLIWMLACKGTLKKLPAWFEAQHHVKVIKEVYRTYSNSSLAAFFNMNSIRPLFEYFVSQDFEKSSHPLLSEHPEQAWQAVNDFRNNFEKFQH